MCYFMVPNAGKKAENVFILCWKAAVFDGKQKNVELGDLITHHEYKVTAFNHKERRQANKKKKYTSISIYKVKE